MNIILTGPMGSGKTSIGKTIAQVLNMNFTDTDTLIVKKTHMNINKIFTIYGENNFRKQQIIKTLIGFITF